MIGKPVGCRPVFGDVQHDGRHGDKTSFGSLLFALIRQQIAGERFEDGSYGANLDAVVRSLDGMTEKDRVSGRVYQPTTASERDDLIWSDVTLLAIYADQDDGGALDKRVQDFVEAEDALPRGDRTLRTILYEFRRYLDVVDTRPPQILEALEQSGREDARGDIDKLGVILRRTESIIAAHRAKRLHDRQIDAAKLEERRAAVEQGLMDEGNLDFFAAAKIVTVEDESEGDVHRFSFNTSKARLLDRQRAAPAAA